MNSIDEMKTGIYMTSMSDMCYADDVDDNVWGDDNNGTCDACADPKKETTLESFLYFFCVNVIVNTLLRRILGLPL